MTDVRTAKLFFLTEPEPGLFIVKFQVGDSVVRIQISREHLANFLVDGVKMALWSQTFQSGAGGLPAPFVADVPQASRPASASRSRPPRDADASLQGDAL